MNIHSRLAELERHLLGPSRDDLVQSEYTCWLPSEGPPPLPDGVTLNDATLRHRELLLAMDWATAQPPPVG